MLVALKHSTTKHKTTEYYQELSWWLETIPCPTSFRNKPVVNFVFNIDPSESGWGTTAGENPAR